MDFLRSIAPWIATAATGGVPALIGLAAKELTDALGADVEPTQEGITRATQAMTHEQILAVKQADHEFQTKMAELGYTHIEKLEALAVDDRKSAREREISVRDHVPSILAYLVTAGFFGILGYSLVYGLPQGDSEALLLLLGSLGTAWTGIMAYYFGSSAGSARKTELIGAGK